MASLEFACKTINLDELIRCSLGIKKTEYALLLVLFDEPQGSTASALAKKVGLDRTTVQKALKHLVDTGLIQKYQVNYSSGGYSFLYRVKSKQQLKQKILSIIDTWTQKIKDTVSSW